MLCYDPSFNIYANKIRKKIPALTKKYISENDFFVNFVNVLILVDFFHDLIENNFFYPKVLESNAKTMFQNFTINEKVIPSFLG